jgi:hypothetical protein
MRGFSGVRLALILLFDAIYQFLMVDSAMMAASEFLIEWCTAAECGGP